MRKLRASMIALTRPSPWGSKPQAEAAAGAEPAANAGAHSKALARNVVAGKDFMRRDHALSNSCTVLLALYPTLHIPRKRKSMEINGIAHTILTASNFE